MRDGALELYLEHPELMLGATSEPDVLVLGGAPAVSSDSHVLIRVRAQIAPVQVSFWSSVEIRVGVVVADVMLNFGEAYFAVFDVDGLVHYRKRIGAPGRHRVRISVDDPEAASRIYVMVGDATGMKGECAPSGAALGSFTSPGGSDLEFLLAEFDRPAIRLAEAIKRIASRSPRIEALLIYDVRKVVEWLRWLRPTVSLSMAQEVGRLIGRGLAGAEAATSGDQARRIADEALAMLDLEA